MENLSKAKRELAIDILDLFERNGIDALPMKLYSDDDDVDIVIINKDRYKEASHLLLSEGWFIKNNRSKLRERDKDFFKNNNYQYVIHLHQAFSWNTIPYLDSEKLWERKQEASGIPLPSAEDELLIIAAHSLFENQHIKPEEVLYGRKLLKSNYDVDYMKKHAGQFNWQEGLDLIVNKLKDNESSLSISELLKIKIHKMGKDIKSGPFAQFATEALNYFFIDWVWNYRLMLQKKILRGPIIISLSGVDGSGKSTQAKLLHEMLGEKGKQVKTLHIGGASFTKRDKSEQTYKIPGLGYLSFIKDASGIFFSFIVNLKYDVLIFDRYIYDTLVKIAYKEKGRNINKFLLSLSQKFLPKPNASFLFEAPGEILLERDKSHSFDYYRIKNILYHSLLNCIPQLTSIKTVGSKKEAKIILEEKTQKILR